MRTWCLLGACLLAAADAAGRTPLLLPTLRIFQHPVPPPAGGHRASATKTKPDAPPARYVVDLDDPPEHRWDAVLAEPGLRDAVRATARGLAQVLAPQAALVDEFIEAVKPELGAETLAEAAGIARAVGGGINATDIMRANLVYELTSGCTVVVAQAADGDGRVLLAANDDGVNGPAVSLQAITASVRFVWGNATLFDATRFVGSTGISHGVSKGGFAMAQNMRAFDIGIEAALRENIAAARAGARTYAELARELFAAGSSYEEALHALATTNLTNPMFLTVAGPKPGQGAVITRGRSDAQVWSIGDGGAWSLVQTNSDHGEGPDDPRRDTANEAMEALGNSSAALTPSNLLSKVVGLKPIVDNGDTTFSAVYDAKSGESQAIVRWSNV